MLPVGLSSEGLGVVHYHSRSCAETTALGVKLGTLLSAGSIVALFGNLGSGKTALIKGIAESAAAWPAESVNSPTFSLMHVYNGAKLTLYHFDLYRLSGSEEFFDLGFDEFLYSGGISCIEWAERIASVLPPESIRIQFSHRGGDCRTISVEGVQ